MALMVLLVQLDLREPMVLQDQQGQQEQMEQLAQLAQLDRQVAQDLLLP
jgi:hypothetical protein